MALPWRVCSARLAAPRPRIYNRRRFIVRRVPVTAVAYTVVPLSPQAHLYRVHCRVPDPDPDGQCLRMPAWIPGSYLVRDFAKHVVTVRAHGDDGEVAVQRLDKNTLRCGPVSGDLRLEYTVYARDPSVRKAWLDERRGFFNGSSLFYCPLGRERGSFQLELRRPADAALADWRVATTLCAEQIDEAGWGLYRAADFDELIDHPVELGRFTRADFMVDGIEHAFILSGRFELDAERLCRDVARICAAQREMFGGEPALDRYLFLTHVVGNGYGGLEHRSSCALVCSRDDLPVGERPGEAYRNFLGLCSHEYFHLWNVKRIRPQAVAESDLSGPAYTRDLWHYEGVTSYYDDLFLRRAGICDRQQYLDIIAANATRVERTPGRAVHSLAESSFEAWIKFYQSDENTPNQTVSYYLKGALAALCVDLHLRLHTAHTLDDVMRWLWRRYGATGTPAPEGALEAAIRELAGAASPPLDDWIRGCDDLPLAELLAAFGVRASRRAATSATDTGGPSRDEPLPGYTGMVLRGGAQIASVLADTPAQRAGLSGGDELVAIDGLRCDSQTQARIDRLRAGQRVRVHYFRDDELHETTVSVAAPPADTWVLEAVDEDREAVARRHAWIGG